ncbi:MAG: glutathione peroxidase [Actinobacteria bacterium]|nr:glutathione peroxidase [Actinomycetota bacterium]
MRIALPALATATAVAALAALPVAASASAPVIPVKERGKQVLSRTYQRLDGDPINLRRLRGRVVLVVNTASHCGYSSQYGPLETLWRERRAQGVTVVGVPSNDFKQEYPSDALVKRFCKRNFGVSFPMLRISKVTGAKAIPLFRGLAAPSWSSQPQWNFNKYLIDTTGRPAMYFPASEEPDSPAMTKAIDALLAERST